LSRPDWWATKTISVYPSSTSILKHVEPVRDIVVDFVREFDLKFKVEIQDYSAFFSNLTEKCSNTGKLDFYRFWEQTERERKNGRFLEGLVILIDDARITEFTDSDPYVWVLDEKRAMEQRGLYGIAEYEKGLMLFRQFQSNLREATRHECGHLFGLGHHCQSGDRNCCMNWACPSETFCDSCRRELDSIMTQ
jgi:hypothetical protein